MKVQDQSAVPGIGAGAVCKGGEIGTVGVSSDGADIDGAATLLPPAPSTPLPLPHAAVNDSAARRIAIAVGRIAPVARLSKAASDNLKCVLGASLLDRARR